MRLTWADYFRQAFYGTGIPRYPGCHSDLSYTWRFLCCLDYPPIARMDISRNCRISSIDPLSSLQYCPLCRTSGLQMRTLYCGALSVAWPGVDVIAGTAG